MPENKFYKYSLKLRWQSICRNRSVEILKERPDLVEQMNRFREKVSNVLKIVCRKSSYIDNNHSMTGIRIWFESGQDVYEFINLFIKFIKRFMNNYKPLYKFIKRFMNL